MPSAASPRQGAGAEGGSQVTKGTCVGCRRHGRQLRPLHPDSRHHRVSHKMGTLLLPAKRNAQECSWQLDLRPPKKKLPERPSPQVAEPSGETLRPQSCYPKGRKPGKKGLSRRWRPSRGSSDGQQCALPDDGVGEALRMMEPIINPAEETAHRHLSGHRLGVGVLHASVTPHCSQQTDAWENNKCYFQNNGLINYSVVL